MKKRFGQNFLIDQNILDMINNIIPHVHEIVEVGGGSGILTKILLTKATNVITIEIDNDLIPALTKVNPNTIHCDALQYNFIKHRNAIFVSNLPYQISVKLLLKLFEQRIFNEYYIMLQKEVAQRLYSEYKSKKYGKLSILSQYSRIIKPLIQVGNESFFPKPKVESEFIYVKEQYIHNEIDWNDFAKILQIAFNNRRKKLCNTLFKNIKSEYNDKRCDELSVDDWIKIYHLFHLR